MHGVQHTGDTSNAYLEVLVACMQGKSNELGGLLSLMINGVVGWMWD
jgi:hypothetical protein